MLQMRKRKTLPSKINNTLCTKIAIQYAFSGSDYPTKTSVFDIVASEYNKAIELFNADSASSIVALTLKFYMDHIDEAIEMYIDGMDDFCALAKLLSAYTKLHLFMSENAETFESELAKELSANSDYYHLFPLSYYRELCSTDGIENALAELYNDINTRAFTFYNCAHNKYLDYLPGLKDLMIKYNISE